MEKEGHRPITLPYHRGSDYGKAHVDELRVFVGT
jgi:hypothetical protein